MAHTKAKGSTKLGRDSESKRLGVKRSDGQAVKLGEIIIRQRGTHYFPGLNVKRGGDDTLYAVKSGRVSFQTKKKIRFDGSRRMAKVVNVR
ncbi:MAG: 50S ribosomal protein L27 [Candidatus Brennerbacteria bacterium]|nr:50S ribosomal protein L27 [Candidatus Brennerbacteria bacterium]